LAAGSAFDMNAYVSKIEAIAVQAVGAEARIKEEAKSREVSNKSCSVSRPLFRAQRGR
jgi:hypothetical protein